MRSVVLAAREFDHVNAAVALGATHRRLLARHILPLTVSPSWCSRAWSRNYLRSAWWLPVFPGLAIMVAVLGANLLGDGLRDALDPRRVHARNAGRGA